MRINPEVMRLAAAARYALLYRFGPRSPREMKIAACKELVVLYSAEWLAQGNMCDVELARLSGRPILVVAHDTDFPPRGLFPRWTRLVITAGETDLKAVAVKHSRLTMAARGKP